MSALEQLRKVTTISADTSSFDDINKYKPTDATTNPSLILKASAMDRYRHLLERAVCHSLDKDRTREERVREAVDYLCVLFGCEILKIVPGRVSIEIDARLSFDTDRSVEKALKLISLCKQLGVGKERVFIKLAATWEGIRAAEILEKEHHVACNVTLVFSLVQAVASAEAGVTVISPFVGRILDWHLAKTQGQKPPQQDPGVVSVRQIYNYLKKFDYKTSVMGASFRNTDEVKALAGCDLLTISPTLLEQLERDESVVPVRLSPAEARAQDIPKLCVYEKRFRWLMNEDPMATELLSSGIRSFTADTLKLEQLIETNFDELGK